MAGVGAPARLNFMVIGFLLWESAAGSSIPLAHKFGARIFSGLRQFIANSGMAVCFVCPQSMTALILFFLSADTGADENTGGYF